MAIRPVREVAHRAMTDLKKYQSGEIKPIKTGRKWLDDIFGGLLPQDIVTITGASGGGKSFELQRVKNSIMDKERNPNADNFIWLSNSLEMRFLSNILRDLNINLEKSKKSILTQEFTEPEKRLVHNYYKQTADNRFYIDEEPITAEEFESRLDAFLSQFTDKEAVFIDIDHIALQKGQDGNKKSVVDGFVEAINRLKKKYPNSVWFILSQLNREILLRSKDKDIMAMPNRGDVYQSDTIYHISDYLYVCHNPYRLGINQFLMVNKKQYDYLEEHFGESDKKGGKTAFNTLGKMFYIVLKSREADVLFDDIYIEDVNIGNLEKYKEEEVTSEINEPDFTTDLSDDGDVPF